MLSFRLTKLFSSLVAKLVAVFLLIALVVLVVYLLQPKYKSPLNLNAEQIQQQQVRVAELKNTLKEFPDYYEVYLELGQVERNLGDYDAAIKYTKKASEVIASSSIPWLNLSSYYSEIEEYNKAYDALWGAQKASPDYYMVYEKIVDFYKWHYPQKQDEIPAVYELGIAQTNDAHLVKAYADYLFDNNRKGDALKYYLQLQQYNPNNETINNRIKEIGEQTSGNY